MRPRTLALLALAAAGFSTACGVPIRSGAHFNRTLDPGQRATFDWNQPEDHVIGDPRLEGNHFFEARLHEAIEWELALRGIQLHTPLPGHGESAVEGSPTFLVHHHLSLSDREYEQEMEDDAGNTRMRTFEFEEGAMAVHVVDAATGETVWLGWALADIEPALASPERMRSWVDDVVNEMFKSWPRMERPGT